MNRIDEKFIDLRKRNRKAFVAFITAGDPSLEICEELVYAFEDKGVDIVELGVPFSDPLADGPIIQAASLRALERGVTLSKILKMVSRIRRKSQMPICLMTYYNPVFHYGEKKFVIEAKKAGVDGIILPDLPPEEAQCLIAQARISNMATIFFLSPTTKQNRLQKIIDQSTGFIYYVSIAGVTGARTALSNSIAANIKKIKLITDKPICVGFGISTSEQVRKVSSVADGVIVGSAIIQELAKNADKKDCVKNVSCFVSRLMQS